MSYDVYLGADTGGDYEYPIEMWNPTYNYGPMFEKALDFPFRDLDGLRAAEAADRLWAAVRRMRVDPETYRALEDPAWGTYNGGVGFLDGLAMACDAHPKTTLRIR